MRTELQQRRYEYKKAWAKDNAEKVRESRKKYEENNEKIKSEKIKESGIKLILIFNMKIIN